MVLSFDQSGAPAPDLTLADVRQLAISHGVTRPDGSADLDAFFRLYGVKALSTFKAKWATHKLQPPNRDSQALAPVTPVLGAGITKVRVSSDLAGVKSQRVAAAEGWKANSWSLEPSVVVACEPLPVAEFPAKSEAAHWDKELKWRLIQRPGGAFIKPDDWYRLYAASMQAKQGDNKSERPMWADHGGIDFHGRASWDAWTELKGMDADQATAKFCRVYAEAHTSERFATNFHGTASK